MKLLLSNLLYPDPCIGTLIDLIQKCWKVNLVCSVFLSFEADVILRIAINCHLPPNLTYWTWTKDGIYSVKSGYKVACKLYSQVVASPLAILGGRLIWKMI